MFCPTELHIPNGVLSLHAHTKLNCSTLSCINWFITTWHLSDCLS
uniref:Uncharacterized protein n=1 Tax=Arundo donax TaxID=35708 RepID=A0A0A9HQA0_ARUDO